MEALRLVKLRLPAALIRAMDQHIVATRGTYRDRNEFVSEAIWDRLNEDADQGATAPAATARSVAERPEPVGGTPSPPVTETPSEGGSRPAEADPFPLGAAVADYGRVPTLPAHPAGGTIFGLHNRDLPSVWLAVVLARFAAEDCVPVPWGTLISRVRSAAQVTAETLRNLDRHSGAPVKSAVGWPKPGDKARASEDRLIATALGAPGRNGIAGPAFVLGLVAADHPDKPRPDLAPTPEALDLLADLHTARFGLTLPQPEAATRRWLAHLAAVAAEEHATWLEVLGVVGEKPTRSELIARFPQWAGSVADTNTAGYVSRGREWGLVHPELHDGRYRLTPLGEHVVTEGTKH